MGLGRRLGVVGIDVVCWGAERGVNIALVSDTSQRSAHVPVNMNTQPY